MLTFASNSDWSHYVMLPGKSDYCPPLLIPQILKQTKPMEVKVKVKNIPEVCKFYLENKCRFGDQCRNRHEGEPVEKVVKKDNLKKKTIDKDRENIKKKSPMKTVADVIKRIQWDKMLLKVKLQMIMILIFLHCRNIL